MIRCAHFACHACPHVVWEVRYGDGDTRIFSSPGRAREFTEELLAYAGWKDGDIKAQLGFYNPDDADPLNIDLDSQTYLVIARKVVE